MPQNGDNPAAGDITAGFVSIDEARDVDDADIDDDVVEEDVEDDVDVEVLVDTGMFPDDDVDDEVDLRLVSIAAG